MEDAASSINPALLAKLRALARRGAYLQTSHSGADLKSMIGSKRPGPQGMTQVELDQALASGLVRAAGPGHYLLTRRGAGLVRRALAEASAAAARGGTSFKPRMAQATRNADKSPPAQPRINVQESPLAWLRQRKDRDGTPMISQLEFEAGEQLRADFWYAQMTPRVTASWCAVPGSGDRRLAPGTGIDIADNVIAARERVRRALAAVGPELSGMLIDVCCHLKGLEQAERGAGLPQRSAKIILQFALSALVRHYGLDQRGTRGLRHWGSPDYRPGMDKV